MEFSFVLCFVDLVGVQYVCDCVHSSSVTISLTQSYSRSRCHSVPLSVKLSVTNSVSIGPHNEFYTFLACEKTRTRIDLPHTVRVLGVQKIIS